MSDAKNCPHRFLIQTRDIRPDRSFSDFWRCQDCPVEFVPESEVASLRSRAEAAEAFKAYVHKRLDEAAVPHDPFPEQTKKTGCRIEGRLAWLEGERGDLIDCVAVLKKDLAEAKAEVERLREEPKHLLNNCSGDLGPLTDRADEATCALCLRVALASERSAHAETKKQLEHTESLRLQALDRQTELAADTVKAEDALDAARLAITDMNGDMLSVFAQLDAERSAHEETRQAFRVANANLTSFMSQLDAEKAAHAETKAKLERVRNKCEVHDGEGTVCGQCHRTARQYRENAEHALEAELAAHAKTREALERIDARVEEVARRMVLSGPKCAHVSASEVMEVVDAVLAVRAALRAPASPPTKPVTCKRLEAQMAMGTGPFHVDVRHGVGCNGECGLDAPASPPKRPSADEAEALEGYDLDWGGSREGRCGAIKRAMLSAYDCMRRPGHAGDHLHFRKYYFERWPNEGTTLTTKEQDDGSDGEVLRERSDQEQRYGREQHGRPSGLESGLRQGERAVEQVHAERPHRDEHYQSGRAEPVRAGQSVPADVRPSALDNAIDQAMGAASEVFPDEEPGLAWVARFNRELDKAVAAEPRRFTLREIDRAKAEAFRTEILFSHGKLDTRDDCACGRCLRAWSALEMFTQALLGGSPATEGGSK